MPTAFIQAFDARWQAFLAPPRQVQPQLAVHAPVHAPVHCLASRLALVAGAVAQQPEAALGPMGLHDHLATLGGQSFWSTTSLPELFCTPTHCSRAHFAQYSFLIGIIVNWNIVNFRAPPQPAELQLPAVPTEVDDDLERGLLPPRLNEATTGLIDAIHRQNEYRTQCCKPQLGAYATGVMTAGAVGGNIALAAKWEDTYEMYNITLATGLSILAAFGLLTFAYLGKRDNNAARMQLRENVEKASANLLDKVQVDNGAESFAVVDALMKDGVFEQVMKKAGSSHELVSRLGDAIGNFLDSNITDFMEKLVHHPNPEAFLTALMLGNVAPNCDVPDELMNYLKDHQDVASRAKEGFKAFFDANPAFDDLSKYYFKEDGSIADSARGIARAVLEAAERNG